jgi:Cu(I)/Ag(I) efflux system periplasmic protein CusF
MKNLKTLVTICALLLGPSFVFAASQAGVAVAKDSAKTEAAVQAPTDMADGEIRKIDKDNKKLTLKHGPIKNLDMPGMTMVFQIKDPAMLDNLKIGDKIKFRAEQTGGAMVVTEIQPVK